MTRNQSIQRRLPNGAVLRVIGADAPPAASSRREDIAVAIKVSVIGALFAPCLLGLLWLAYDIKTRLGLKLTDGPSPIHEFLDNWRQTELK